MIFQWIRNTVSQSGEARLQSKALREFTQYFRGTSSANFMRAERIWNDQDKYADADGSSLRREALSTVTRVNATGLHTVRMKARPGRGRRRSAWVEVLHVDLRNEFDRLRKLGDLNTLQVRWTRCVIRKINHTV